MKKLLLLILLYPCFVFSDSLGGSKEFKQGANPFELIKDLISPSSTKNIKKTALKNWDGNERIFKSIDYDFNEDEIRSSIAKESIIEIDITKPLELTTIEILFLTSIARKDYYQGGIDYDLYFRKIFKRTSDTNKALKEEQSRLQSVVDEGSETADQIKKIKENIFFMQLHYRKWSDISQYLVNSMAGNWKGGYKENSWVYGINPAIEDYYKVGQGVTVWSVISEIKKAEIYYLSREYILAEQSAHNALLSFFLMQRTKTNQITEDYFQIDIAFFQLLEYFYYTSANKKMTDLLVKSFLNNRDFSNTPVNSDLAIALTILASEHTTGELGQEGEKYHLNKNNNFNDLIGQQNAIHALRLSLSGEKHAAEEYWRNNKVHSDLAVFINDFADGYINKSADIPSSATRSMIRLIKTGHNQTEDSYIYQYILVYENILNALGLINKKRFDEADGYLQNSLKPLISIATLFRHPPGAPIPAATIETRLLLEILIDMVIKSSLPDIEKEKFIAIASMVSLDKNELQFVTSQDLVDNAHSEYAKDIAITLNSLIIKRQNTYKNLLANFSESKPFLMDDAYALDQINQLINNAQNFLIKKNLIFKKNKVLNLGLQTNEALINLFCMETHCYSYKKINSDIDLTTIKKNDLYELKKAFTNKIADGLDISFESKRVGDFLLGPFSQNRKIKHCNIVATSGLSTIPFALTKVMNQYLIDFCNISIYTSIQHFQRSSNKRDFEGREKWALAIADPIIESAHEKLALKKTLVLLRGFDSIDDLTELPETRFEASAIVGMNKNQSTILDRELATKTNLFKENLSDYQVLSFSTHGLMAGETSGNLNPAVLMTEDSMGRLLDTNDILSLNGSPSIVVLAVCNASKSIDNLDVTQITNLANAFIMKGSDALISTYWSLNSKASVAIITETFRLYAEGIELGGALQRAAISYRNNTPDSLPKDWGAMFVIGKSIKSNNPSPRKITRQGFIFDALYIEDNIKLITYSNGSQIGIDQWDSKGNFLSKITISEKNIKPDDMKTYRLRDARFVSEDSTSFLSLSDKELFYWQQNEENEQYNYCAIPVNDYQKIMSVTSDENKVYFSLKSSLHSNNVFGFINKIGCTFSTRVIDTKNKKNSDWANNAGFYYFEKDLYIFQNFDLPDELSSENHLTYSGLPQNCLNTHLLSWSKFTINDDDSIDPFKWDPGWKQVLLPTFSRGQLQSLIVGDSCSSRNALFNNPETFIVHADKPVSMELLPIYFSKDNFGDGPWRINSVSASIGGMVTTETFFDLYRNSFSNNSFRDIAMNRFLLSYNIVLNDGSKGGRYIEKLRSCLNPIVTGDKESTYVVCNQFTDNKSDSYYVQKIH